MQTNIFCSRSNLHNEASVETWFVDPLLEHLGFGADDINLKESLKTYKIGKGSKSDWYKPDYVVLANKFPTLVIDAKAPDVEIDNWVQQCSSYCLEINRSYEHRPVEYFFLSNGLSLKLYKWDKGAPLLEMDFDDFVPGSQKLDSLKRIVGKASLIEVAASKEKTLLEGHFELKPATQNRIADLFSRLHRFIWTTENMAPSAAFSELMKIVFVKIKKDRELHEKHDVSKLKVGDVVFSLAWIKGQTEHENPINDPLFKNLTKDLEREIVNNNKRRIFDTTDDIDLSPSTIERIVADLEHLDLYATDEDVHGRMFEIFLAATIRGKELGQYFTPRDIVRLMVGLSDLKVAKNSTDIVLDPCCGSGGFLIVALADMWQKAEKLVGLSNRERNKLKANIANRAIRGIDAGNTPAMHRIARMNMYLHGDGGSNVFFADSLDKTLGQIGPHNLERDREIEDLRKMLVEEEERFDVVLANPPFSLKFSRKDAKQRQVLDQYTVAALGKQAPSLLSSVMFLERYRDLVRDEGRVLAVIDDSVLSGSKYRAIRNYIRQTFIIRGVISLPGDAFRHAASRVKTSVLILRPKKQDEEQGEVFMEKAIYLGLTDKMAKRIGISREEWEAGRAQETERIVNAYLEFEAGNATNWVVSPERITDRLDVKHCLNERGRKTTVWTSKGQKAIRLGKVLAPVEKRVTKVEEEGVYRLLKVTYEGRVLEGDTIDGADLSYSQLSKVETWDVVFSNMGVGRGAIGIVPQHLAGFFVSNEYTVLRAGSSEEAIYYTTVIRSKEILGDVLTVGTGLNRGRIRWSEMSTIEIPEYNPDINSLSNVAKAMVDLWNAQEQFETGLQDASANISQYFALEDDSARERWLSYKPPE